SVVVVHHVQERRESSVMIETSLVCGTHEETILTHEDAGQIHRLVHAIRSAVGLETIDADLRWCVQVPTWLRPKRLHVTIVALRLTTKQLVSTFRSCDIEVYAGFRRRSRYSELIEMQLRKFLRYAILLRRN